MATPSQRASSCSPVMICCSYVSGKCVSLPRASATTDHFPDSLFKGALCQILLDFRKNRCSAGGGLTHPLCLLTRPHDRVGACRSPLHPCRRNRWPPATPDTDSKKNSSDANSNIACSVLLNWNQRMFSDHYIGGH